MLKSSLLVLRCYSGTAAAMASPPRHGQVDFQHCRVRQRKTLYGEGPQRATVVRYMRRVFLTIATILLRRPYISMVTVLSLRLPHPPPLPSPMRSIYVSTARFSYA